MKNTINNKKGFTVVELLAVVVVIAIIALIAFASVYSIMGKARDKQYETNLDSMGSAVRLFGDDAKNGLSNINNALVYKDNSGKTWKVGCKKDGISKKCCVRMSMLRDIGYLKVTDDDLCGDNKKCDDYYANITYSGNSVAVELLYGTDSCEIIKFKVLYHSVEKINSGDEDTVEGYCEYNKPCKLKATPNEFHLKYPGHTVINWEDRRGNLYETNSEVDLTLRTTTDIFDLFANWKNNEFTFTYHGNTSTSGTMTPSHHTYQDGSSLKANVYQKIGYSYLYWNDKADGSGRKYENREPVSENTFDDGTNINLYAQWKPNNYNVTFDANNGTNLSFSSKVVTFDSAYGDLPTVSRVGYTFKGWYTALTGGTKITESTIVKTPNNHTLYARWEANKYTVTFDKNTGNNPNPGSKTVTYDSKYGDLASITKEGYDFQGWYTEKIGGTKVTKDTIVKTASNHTLYAQWKPSTYTVTFNKNGGNNPNPGNKTVTFDSAYGTLASIDRTGYDFTGWYKATSGNDKVETTTIVKTASNHTLYAHWNARKYTVTYNANSCGTTTGTTKEVTYDSAYGSLASFTATAGYRFDGWYTAASGGTNITPTTTVKTASNHTLYAHCTNLCTATTQSCTTAWGAWGNCSKSCGGGTKTRSGTKTCVDGFGTGYVCSTSTVSGSTSCNTQGCCTSTYVSGHGSWGSCSASCGGGTKSRAVYYKSNYDNSSCSSGSESTSCNTQSCCVLGGGGDRCSNWTGHECGTNAHWVVSSTFYRDNPPCCNTCGRHIVYRHTCVCD